MTICVFGANGKVGSLVVRELLRRGHSVRAFVHGSNPFEGENNVTVVQGDIYNASDVHKAITGADAVMSALGSWGTPKKNILSVGMGHIAKAMAELKIQRIVSLTGDGAWTPDEQPSIVRRLTHTFFGLLAGKILRDGEEHIRILQESSLDWTVIRSPVMNEKGTERYRLRRKPTLIRTIHRGSVARSMVDCLESNTWNHEAPFIVRS